MNLKFSRPLHIASEIVFLDGMNGAGKSILAPILGSFERVEKQALNHIFEHVCLSHHFGKMTSDAAESFLSLYADLSLYNSMISREVNLRPSDDSGILNNPRGFEYLKRLFRKDGDYALQSIEKEKPILQLMTHQMLPLADILFETFKGRARVIEMMRHPIYMLEHWMSYIGRYGADKREFNFWIEWEGELLPWFAGGWEDEFVKSSPMDRVIFAIERLSRQIYEKYELFGPKLIHLVPFEKLVLDPKPQLHAIQCFLGTKSTRNTLGELKKQKCPRPKISDGKGHARYGWKKVGSEISEKTIFEQKLNFARANASAKAFDALMELSREYVKRFEVQFL